MRIPFSTISHNVTNIFRSQPNDGFLVEKKSKRRRNSRITRLFTTTEVCKACYMDGSEFVSHIEATLLRCASSKGHTDDDHFDEILGCPELPTKNISRDVYTSVWIDSFR